MKSGSCVRLFRAMASCVLSIACAIPIISAQPASAQSGVKPNQDLYAVVVGIRNYQDSSIPELVLSDQDAKDFRDFLVEHKDLFGKTHIEMLLNEEATRANVAEALRKSLRPAKKDDIVIIYLSGHGATDATLANEFYFVTQDSRLDNLFGTALLMNDANLFKGIDSDKVLLISDACHSGGFGSGLDRAVAKSASNFLASFEGMKGRIALASSRPDEKSYEKDIYGNSVFTHFLLKGLKGEADSSPGDGAITAGELYGFVYNNTKNATKGLQSPQLYCAKGMEKDTSIFMAPKFAAPLNIKVQFFYEGDDKKVRPITDGARLKSGAHVGVAFRSRSDCYVYIYWWDSSGNVGRLFPNPELTEGTGAIKAEETYWLPSRGGERWYVLDDNPGTETIYFAASRKKNQKLEYLYGRLAAMPTDKKAGREGKETAAKIQRELTLMGFANHTAAKGVSTAAFEKKESCFEDLESQIKVSGADALYKVQFRHDPR